MYQCVASYLLSIIPQLWYRIAGFYHPCYDFDSHIISGLMWISTVIVSSLAPWPSHIQKIASPSAPSHPLTLIFIHCSTIFPEPWDGKVVADVSFEGSIYSRLSAAFGTVGASLLITFHYKKNAYSFEYGLDLVSGGSFKLQYSAFIIAPQKQTTVKFWTCFFWKV